MASATKAIIIDGADTGRRSVNPGNAAQILQSQLKKQNVECDLRSVQKAMRTTKNAFSLDTSALPRQPTSCNEIIELSVFVEAALSFSS